MTASVVKHALEQTAGDTPTAPPDIVSKWCFTIVTHGRTLVLAAQNEFERTSWIEAILARIAAFKLCTSGWLKVSEGRYAQVNGRMMQRCVATSGNWKKGFFVLMATEIVDFKDEDFFERVITFFYSHFCSHFSSTICLKKKPMDYHEYHNYQGVNDLPLTRAQLVPNVDVGGTRNNSVFALRRAGARGTFEKVYVQAANIEEKAGWVNAIKNQLKFMVRNRKRKKLQGSVFSLQVSRESYVICRV